MNATPIATENTTVPAIEQALDLLLGETKAGDTVKRHLERCSLTIAGRAQREQFFTAAMAALNEAGVRALDPAARIAEAMTDKGAEQTALEQANGNTVH